MPAWLGRVKALWQLASSAAGSSSSSIDSSGRPHPGASSVEVPSSVTPVESSIQIAGREQGWLRVLRAEDLIQMVQAQKAVRQMWHQSRLAQPVFERDLLPAIHRYAEYVQLMPASEAHHHAHAGGLLSHTLEMVLAAMTWRNGHFLPTSAPVEQIDAERDQWTYVVFFAALLHDIAKPMTDLRILWRGGTMSEPLRWKPIAGSLAEVGDGRAQLEYRVEFEPKVARDYQAHSRLALTLLSQIAPGSALTFLSRTPHAFDALTQYLSGTKSGLLAEIIQRADRASTSNALLKGNKARFATANAVPLVDLLMQAVKTMLVSGTELPLNRSGAAGWVFDGSIWFVAKRLADTTRAWIKAHAPEESIPGEAKNDRLFDTWQEYGILQANPHTGQAIWLVQVIGQVQERGEGQGASGQEEEGGGTPTDEAAHQYSHNLSMLRFPLNRLYEDASRYPPAMAGKIVVRQKREADSPGDQDAEQGTGAEATQEAMSATPLESEAIPTKPASQPAGTSGQPSGAHPVPRPSGPKAAGLPAPSFNKPKPKPGPEQPSARPVTTLAPTTAANPGGQQSAAIKSSPEKRKVQTPSTTSSQNRDDDRDNRHDPVFPPLEQEVDGFDATDDEWLDPEDESQYVKYKRNESSISNITKQPSIAPVKRPAPTPAKTAANVAASSHQEAAPMPCDGSSQIPPGLAEQLLASTPISRATPANQAANKRPLEACAQPTNSAKAQRLFTRQEAGAGSSSGTTPVVLTPSLPALPHATTAKKKEPSETALGFIQWVQQGLASREIKYNETGAPVHFVEEGMALVSPVIFKIYAHSIGPEEDADAMGLQVQREVIKAGWHRMAAASGSGKVNILRYQVIGRGNVAVARLSAVVLLDPDRFVLPVPPANPVLKLENEHAL
ncbi:DNA-binding domain-containing protein [Diaphorobacter sp. HDW4A]|uniref:MobH family relaxase n=1 Tax=Diaphorobacter sp. HDW4A TaxID=2714924 RepID=UPI00140D8E91|nr:MobH family relaxase [Diaphorobacter sp. HDW4A]QIL80317.1 DNA-binding domain-containing protein [Diaphorobacter sp. HDW4A]